MAVNPVYVLAASYLPRAERERRHALVDLAIRQGARQGPSSVWPAPHLRVPAELTQSPEIVHWVRHSLRLSAEERAELRAAIALLPPEAQPVPPSVRQEPLAPTHTPTGGPGRLGTSDAPAKSTRGRL